MLSASIDAVVSLQNLFYHAPNQTEPLAVSSPQKKSYYDDDVCTTTVSSTIGFRNFSGHPFGRARDIPKSLADI